MKGPTALWYLTRSTGIVALVVLSAVMVLGLVTSMGWRSPRWPRFVSQAMHRNLSLFCLLFIAAHIVTTVTDGFAPIGYIDAVIPFQSPYRPVWLGLGALSLDLLLIVSITSALRHRIGHRAWRGIHWLAYASWPEAVLHGLGTGTDAAHGLMLAITAGCVAAVVVALAWRLAAGWRERPGPRLVAAAAAGLFVLAAGLLVLLGPLRPGWARRSGTPPAILAALSRTSGSAPPAATTGRTGSSGPAPAGPQAPPPSGPGSGGSLPTGSFSADVSGTLTTSQPDATGQVTVQIKGRLTGDVSLPFTISLQGTPSGGGVAMNSGVASIGDVQGPVVSLEGSRIVTEISSGGTSVRVSFVLDIDPSSGTVSGTARSGGYPEDDR